MTDIEDDGTALEILCRNYGNNLYRDSLRSSKETPGEFFLNARREACKGRADQYKAIKSVTDFVSDSYRFYRLHREMGAGEATEFALRDTYAYMMALANDQPRLIRRMHDDWWYG